MVDGLRVNDLGVELGRVLQTRYDRFSLEAPPPREGEVRGAVAIVADGAGGILLVHRTDNHLLGLPGGRMNPGEAPAATADRETQEEAGLTVRVVGDFGRVDPVWTFRYPLDLPPPCGTADLEPCAGCHARAQRRPGPRCADQRGSLGASRQADGRGGAAAAHQRLPRRSRRRRPAGTEAERG